LENLSAPAGTENRDATDFVMPDVDCHSHSMLDTINEGTLAVTSMVQLAMLRIRRTSIFIASSLVALLL
jgi:hypothetical protein